MLRPLPLLDSARLCVIKEKNLTTGERTLVAPANYFDWMEQSRTFTGLAAFTRWRPLLRQEGMHEQLPGARVTANFFAVLGVSPILGPGFDSSSTAGAGQVVLSYELWHSRFGGNSEVIGQTMALRELNGEEVPYVIVGVMPSGFRFPWPLLADRPALWSLLRMENERQSRKGKSLHVVGRLRTQATVSAAEAEMQWLARQLEQVHPTTNRNWSAAGITAVAAVTNLSQQRSWPWTVSARRSEGEPDFEGKAELRFVRGDLFRVLAIPCSEAGHFARTIRRRAPRESPS